MMVEAKDNEIIYTCVNNEHKLTGKSEGVYMSANMAAAYNALGNNVDLLLEYLKRP